MKQHTYEEKITESLEGKAAIVTGGSSGIGRATAERLARNGASVVINYARSGEQAAAVVDAIKDRGGSAWAVQADMAKLEEMRRLFCTAVEHLGRLDILVANAGYAFFKPFAETTEEDFDKTYALNAKGTFFCLQESLGYIADGGRIVCVSTIGTELNVPGGACYFGSKAAVEQYCRVLAKEVAPRGITVNVVSPGFTRTKMLDGLLANMSPQAPRELIGITPLGRFGEPEEVAEIIAFLVSDRGRFITRQNIAVDGGIVSR